MRKEDGYFTVEAAMVFPIAFGVVLLVIYLLFFQYNRCLAEQDAGMAVLYGATVCAENHEVRMEKIRNRMNLLDDNKYIAWERDETELKLEKGEVVILSGGRMTIPFGKISDEMVVKVTSRNKIWNPVSLMRMYCKIVGGKE